MPKKYTKHQLMEKLSLDSDYGLAFSMWAEDNQHAYITKSECCSSGFYRSYLSGFFKDEHDKIVHKNIELLMPKFFKYLEDTKGDEHPLTKVQEPKFKDGHEFQERKVAKAYKTRMANDKLQREARIKDVVEKDSSIEKGVNMFEKKIGLTAKQIAKEDAKDAKKAGLASSAGGEHRTSKNHNGANIRKSNFKRNKNPKGGR